MNLLILLWCVGGLIAYILTVKYWYKKCKYDKLEFDIPFTTKEKLLIHLFGLFLASGGWVGVMVYYKCSK